MECYNSNSSLGGGSEGSLWLVINGESGAMDLGVHLGGDPLEDAPEASLPRHRVVVVGQTAEPVVQDVSERLEVLPGDALDVGKLVGEMVERELERVWLVERRDDVVEGVEEAQRVDLEGATVGVVDVNCRQRVVQLWVLLHQSEQTELAEADLEFGRLYVMPELLPLRLDGVSIGRRAAVLLLSRHSRHGDTREHDQTQHLR